ncbi:DUF4340 domain-containing protein [Mahella sp.]|uniref:DUF4340 domain-containing protein n=1 Tax=Mahella sp. TaxID=2798721 RepID=UPI0025C21C97|nr:DUF4340 domain-containing protein [Mahella sp.]MBZ4665040.1 hypothetical protein [Mahella sp.]MDK2903028.1 hypothetical protein [Clostridiales bacterium]
MRRTRNVIILVVVLALLAGTYAYLTRRPQQAEQDSESVEISKLNKDDIVKMTLERKDGSLTFVKKDDKWVAEGNESIALNQTAVDDLAYTFASLYAEQVVEEDPQDLAQYGLKEPVVTAMATLKDNTVKTLYLGNKTPTGTYYLMAEGDPKVYEVWMNHGEHLSYTLNDVRDTTLPQINTQELTYLKMWKEGGRTIEIKTNESQTEDQAQFGLGLWQMTQPYSEPVGVDTQYFQPVLDALPNIAIDGFVEDNPKDLAQYGLDKPKGELIVKDKQNTLHLLIGDDKDDTQVYFKTADSPSVYVMSKDKLTFMDTEPYDIMEKFAYIVNIDDVDRIIVEANGKTHDITLSRTTKKAEEEGEEDEVITTYKVDGKVVEEDPFKQYYQSLIGMTVDAEIDEQLEEVPEVKTTFFLNKGSEREVHVNYVPYNRDFYAVFRGGKAEFVLSKQQVDKMLQDLEDLIAGKLEAD